MQAPAQLESWESSIATEKKSDASKNALLDSHLDSHQFNNSPNPAAISLRHHLGTTVPTVPPGGSDGPLVLSSSPSAKSQHPLACELTQSQRQNQQFQANKFTAVDMRYTTSQDEAEQPICVPGVRPHREGKTGLEQLMPPTSQPPRTTSRSGPDDEPAENISALREDRIQLAFEPSEEQRQNLCSSPSSCRIESSVHIPFHIQLQSQSETQQPQKMSRKLSLQAHTQLKSPRQPYSKKSRISSPSPSPSSVRQQVAQGSDQSQSLAAMQKDRPLSRCRDCVLHPPLMALEIHHTNAPTAPQAPSSTSSLPSTTQSVLSKSNSQISAPSALHSKKEPNNGHQKEFPCLYCKYIACQKESLDDHISIWHSGTSYLSSENPSTPLPPPHPFLASQSSSSPNVALIAQNIQATNSSTCHANISLLISAIEAISRQMPECVQMTKIDTNPSIVHEEVPAPMNGSAALSRSSPTLTTKPVPSPSFAWFPVDALDAKVTKNPNATKKHDITSLLAAAQKSDSPMPLPSGYFTAYVQEGKVTAIPPKAKPNVNQTPSQKISKKKNRAINDANSNKENIPADIHPNITQHPYHNSFRMTHMKEKQNGTLTPPRSLVGQVPISKTPSKKNALAAVDITEPQHHQMTCHGPRPHAKVAMQDEEDQNTSIASKSQRRVEIEDSSAVLEIKQPSRFTSSSECTFPKGIYDHSQIAQIGHKGSSSPHSHSSQIVISPLPTKTSLSCRYCVFTTDNVSLLESHITDTHSIQPPSALPTNSANGITTPTAPISTAPSESVLQRIPGTNQYPCPKCSFTSDSTNAIYDHICQHHQNVRIVFCCPLCDYRTFQKEVLHMHGCLHHREEYLKSFPHKRAQSLMRARSATTPTPTTPSKSSSSPIAHRQSIESMNRSKRNTTLFSPITNKGIPSIPHIIPPTSQISSPPTVECIIPITGTNTYPCPRCGYTSENRHTLHQHIAQVHPKVRVGFSCLHCNFNAPETAVMKNHLVTQHRDKIIELFGPDSTLLSTSSSSSSAG